MQAETDRERRQVVSGSVPGVGLQSVVEAILYAADGPMNGAEILDVIQRTAAQGKEELDGEIDTSSVELACEALSRRLLAAGSALQIIEVAGGFRLTTGPRYDSWIRALRHIEGRRRLSLAALETLAVVAFRQPATAAEIAAVRGVDPSSALRTLRDQGLVRIVGRKRAVGRPFTYGTTRQFLLTFGLRDLSELPAPAEFEELLEG